MGIKTDKGIFHFVWYVKDSTQVLTSGNSCSVILINLAKMKLKNLNFLLWFYIAVTVIASIHKYFIGRATNYLTFSTSFWNLVNKIDLYYPTTTHWDYKYSPTFSLLFAPLAILPDWLGGILWNLINIVVFYFAVTKLELDRKKKLFLLWFLFFELLTSLQNFQSNILLCGLFILTIVNLEKGRNFRAAFFAVLPFFIKIFGSAMILIFLFYPKRTRSLLYGIFWFATLLILPLAVVSPEWLIQLYKSWFNIMSSDFSTSMGYSVMTVIGHFTEVNKSYVQMIGTGLLLMPAIFCFKKFKDPTFRMTFTASIMVWMVIFNHKAESPTFIIAVVGVCLWYLFKEPDHIDKVILLLVFVFTTLSYTDLLSKILVRFADLPTIKVLPCIIAWTKIQLDLFGLDTKYKCPFARR